MEKKIICDTFGISCFFISISYSFFLFKHIGYIVGYGSAIKVLNWVHIELIAVKIYAKC